MQSTNLKAIRNQNALTDIQKLQFRQVVMEGLKGKFANTLHNDTKSMLSIVDVWIRYEFLPMDETFCIVEEATGNVLAILLLNNFKKPTLIQSVRCLIGVCRLINVRRAFKIAFQFLAVDNYNKEMPQLDVVAEIYLIATREDQRGKGVGTMLLQHVLDHLQSYCVCGLEDGCSCKVNLLVFAKNPAKRLYERVGFTQVKAISTPRVAAAFGEEYDSLVKMERPLILV